MQNKRKIGILGATGSIGLSASSLILGKLSENFDVEFLSCNENTSKLLELIKSLNPKAIAASEEVCNTVRSNFPKLNIYSDVNVMLENHKTDVVLHAISGTAGIKSVLSAIKNTKILAIANKECIVSAWNFIQEASIEYGTQIIPVDSEHNSLYQILENINPDAVKKIGITASGGPFFGTKFTDLKNITPSDVLKHPTWQMGIKNTVDSATMANKVLELIEAMCLFSCNDVDVVINRQSIVHANVWLNSGGILSFNSRPDMKFHIAHAIMFPNYEEEPENILNNVRLDFNEIKKEEFPIYFLGRDMIKTKDSVKFTIFNVANEVAVHKFCNGEIKYTEILNIIDKSLSQIQGYEPSSIGEVMNLIEEIRTKIIEIKI